MKTTAKVRYGWRPRWLPDFLFASLCVMAAVWLALGGCSGDSSSDGTASSLPSPQIQSYTGDTFTVLDWPLLDEATGYNVYVTTDGSDPTPIPEHLLEAGVMPPYVHGDWQTDGSWVTGDGPLEAGFTYRYVITAQWGETEGPCSNCVDCYLELPGGGIWRIEGLGNNLSVPMLFAEGRGTTGLVVSDPDTGVMLHANTGLRTPTVVKIDGETRYTEDADILNPAIPGEIVTEPLLYDDDLVPVYDPLTKTFTDELAYAQGTESIWQADWIDGSVEPQAVAAAWGDNLTGHQWTASQDILRVEVNLTQTLPGTETMTGYDMIALFGGKYAEFFGATGATSELSTRVVYTPHARLQIERMDTLAGMPLPEGFDWSVVPTVEPMLYDGAVWQNYLPEYASGNDTFTFGAEINGSGSLTYGYVWDLKGQGVTSGWYRLTLRLDPLANCTQTTPPAAAATALSDSEVTLYPDEDVPVNTFLAPVAGPVAEGDGPLFPAALVRDPNYGGDMVYMSVLYIYIATGN